MLHNISIHTSAREVTLHLSQFHSCYLFQSTLLQGKWRIKALKSFSDVISIHTSAREVTGGKVFIKRPLRNFNPHFRKGSDHSNLDGLWPYGIFQSTLPQGKWQILLLYPLIYYQISIHTSAREVTKLQFGLTQQNIISIHTSAREVTVISFCISQSTFISIHTSAREVTLISFRIPSAFGFQSTLPQGKWRVWCGIPSAGSGISIHTSAREVTVSRKCGIAININFNPHFRKGSDFHSLWSIYNL